MKKCISIFLIAMIVLLANAALVSADTPALSLLDTFDELDVGEISATEIAAYSNAFDNNSYFRPNDAQISITADGVKGNAVTFVENGGTECYIDIRNGRDNANFAPTNDAPVYLSFKMKIVDSISSTEQFLIKTSAGSTLMYVSNNGGYMWWHPSDTGRFSCVEGEWVDVLIKMTVGKTEIKVSDAYGHVNTYSRAETSSNIRITNAQKKVGSSFALDEIRISQGEEIPTEPVVQTPEGLTLTQPTEGVSRMPEFNFCYEPFMKVVSNDIVVSVADKDGEPVDSNMYEVTTNFGIVNVKFTEMLEKDSPYTITLSGVKDMDGADVSPYDFTFTTELAHKITLNDLNITSGDTPAIELTFDGIGGYPSTDVRVMSVIYDDGQMTYLDYRTGVIDADGNLVLSSYTLPSGRELSDLTILVFADSQQLIPVCEAIKCFE